MGTPVVPKMVTQRFGSALAMENVAFLGDGRIWTLRAATSASSSLPTKYGGVVRISLCRGNNYSSFYHLTLPSPIRGKGRCGSYFPGGSAFNDLYYMRAHIVSHVRQVGAGRARGAGVDPWLLNREGYMAVECAAIETGGRNGRS
jgi:hypothetical protein